MATVLPGYAANTLLLVALVSVGTTAVGAGAAWLVTMHRFPGSRLFEVLLVLPLAFPAYVLAYAYTDLMSHSGPVQAALRALTGWGPRDYWFPNIRSLPGAALMFVCVLYPYVYLLARAAFAQQSATAYLAARSLGRGPWAAFLRVSLPMARPAIAAGVLLAIMETIADYGTVAHFAVRTFSTGIYQAWFAMQDRPAAAQLALCLLGFALVVAVLERIERGQARAHMRGARLGGLEKEALTGLRGWAAAAPLRSPGAGRLRPAGGDPRADGAAVGPEPVRGALSGVHRELADAGRDRGGRDGGGRGGDRASRPGRRRGRGRGRWRWARGSATRCRAG